MPQYFQKPENALKRANEFIDIGKKEAALDVLYDVIKSKKHRVWQKIHEPILRTYLSLCVDLKRSVNAKEGLYQYKQICQQVNTASLEEIISFFLTLAEKHADEAKNQSIELVTVEDLDQVQTPEGILLSSVSAEKSQDRSDRVLLTPWVKFLWEAYRNVLELLRNNNRVERLYHETAQSAFKFCLKYARRAEFRKLCVLIKNHLDQVLKYQGQPTAINLHNPDSLQMHLETRLFQLENAITMELWQEAFRGIEGIHYLMQLSKKQPKPHMMANYYGKVALVFFKADNMLFHAAALLKLFTLIKEQKKAVTTHELENIGSKVLLASLSIPIPPGKSSMEEYLSYNSLAADKDRKLTNLLALISPPTRKSLLAEVESIILPYLPAHLSELYFVLEKKFQPLKLCKTVNEILSTVSQNESLLQYVAYLQEITTLRMLKQVAQVYESMSFEKLLKMIPFTSTHKLERIIVSCVKDGDIQITINHRDMSISFGSALVVALKEEVADGPYIQAMPSEILRYQLIALYEGLSESTKLKNYEQTQIEHQQMREQLHTQYLRQEFKEHSQLLNRKSVIEARKEKIESMRTAQEKMEQEKLQKQKQKLKIAEEKRLEIERERREKERKKQEMKEIQKQQVWDRVESLRGTDVGKRAFKNLSAKEIDEMDPDDILQRQYEQLHREKKEQISKLRTQEKRIDHLVRAMRIIEIPLIQKQIADKRVKDEQEWDREEKERIKKAVKDHKLALANKERLGRMQEDKKEFLDKLFGNRHAEHKMRLQKFEDHLQSVRAERLEARKMQRIAERRQEFITLRREQKRKEKEEQLRKEEERKKIEEEERAIRLEQIAQKQREKEREIEEKLRRQQIQKKVDLDAPRDEGWESWPHSGDGKSSALPSAGDSGGRYIPPGLKRNLEASRDKPPPDGDRRRDGAPLRDRGDDWRGSDDRFSRRSDFDRRDMDRRGDGEWRRDMDRPSDSGRRAYQDPCPGDKPAGDPRGDFDRGSNANQEADNRRRGNMDKPNDFDRFRDSGRRDEGDRPYDDRYPRRDDRFSRRDEDGWRNDRDTRGYNDRMPPVGDRDGRFNDSTRGSSGFGGRWRDDGRGGGGGGNWRSDTPRSEGRSWQASRVRSDRDRDDRFPRDEPYDRSMRSGDRDYRAPARDERDRSSRDDRFERDRAARDRPGYSDDYDSPRARDGDDRGPSRDSRQGGDWTKVVKR